MAVYTAGVREGFLEEAMELQAGRLGGFCWYRVGGVGGAGG